MSILPCKPFISWLGLVFMLFVPAYGHANNLESIKISQGSENSQVFRIVLSEQLSSQPIHFTTANPHRIVIDLPGVNNALGRLTETVDKGGVRAYHVAQAADRTRVVIELSGPTEYALRTDKNMFLVALKGSQTEPGASAPAHFESTDTKSPFNIQDVTFKRGNNGEGRVEVSLSNPGAGIDIKQKGQNVQIDFLNTGLPKPLQRKLDVSEFATPIQSIETVAQDKMTRMVVSQKGKWDYFAYQTGKSFILEITPFDSPVQSASKKRYDGEKLSLDFQDVEVRAVLKVLADFTGLNIVTADSVSGNVTIRLKDVPWDQALDIILRAKGLDKRVNGNVIWVEQSELLIKKESEEKRSKRSNEELEELVTRNYRLNYIRADDAMTILSGGSRTTNNADTTPSCTPSSEGLKTQTTSSGASTQGGASRTTNLQSGNTSESANNRVLSSRGAASFDLTTNTLIITDIEDRHAKVEEVLKGIDKPARQVLIEARIVLADDGFGRHLGTRLGFQTTGVFNGTSAALSTGMSTSGTNADSLAKAGSIGTSTGFNFNLPTSVGAPAFGFTLLSPSSETLISLELQALETDNRGKILSNPKVITTNLKPAVILQGTQIPYQTTSADGTQTAFKDALLCLLVAPQVLNNDDVILDVEVTKDAQGETTDAGPAINVKRVQTQVRVKNGETAVLGGIYEQTQRNDSSKVPLLGDVPLLGALFRNNAKTDTKSEMLIFLTPRIIQE